MPNQPMKIAVSAIQFCPEAGDVTGNLKRIEKMVAQAVDNGGQLIVLPEVCDIGYDLQKISSMVSQFPNRSTDFVSGLTQRFNVAILIGLAEKTKEGIFNVAVLFGQDGGVLAKYAKTHLCPLRPLNEPEIFRQGADISVVGFMDFKLGVTICHDIRFPEIYRKLALGGAGIVLHPSAFTKIRINHLEVCLKARAIENQLYMVVANCCGEIGRIEFGGRSMIISPDGRELAKAPDEGDAIITEVVDLGEVARLREEQAILSMRRPELY